MSVLAVGNVKDYAKLTDFHHHPQRSQVYHSCAVLLPKSASYSSHHRVHAKLNCESKEDLPGSTILCHSKLLTHLLPALGCKELTVGPSVCVKDV